MSENIREALTLEGLVEKREARIASASPELGDNFFTCNKLAAQRHPESLRVVIKKAEHIGGGAVAFTLASIDGGPLPMFRAGQFIDIPLMIGDSRITRVYSLCSSPAESLKGIYQIAVKRDIWASSYIQDNWKVGGELTISAPNGEFGYSRLRDAAHVVGLAGGSGITPFLSMARALRDGAEKFDLTLLYGCRGAEDRLFASELDEIARTCPAFRVVYVLSEGEAEDCERGYLTAELIKKYMKPGDNSIFMCGPSAMYSFLDGEIAKLGLRRKFVRRVMPGSVREPAALPGWPRGNEERGYTLTVKLRDESFTVPASGGEPVLVALERAGIPTRARCRSGSCGYCRAKLVSGSVFVPEDLDGRRAADLIYGYIHPCSSWPVSDLSIEL